MVGAADEGKMVNAGERVRGKAIVRLGSARDGIFLIRCAGSSATTTLPRGMAFFDWTFNLFLVLFKVFWAIFMGTRGWICLRLCN